MARTKNNDKLFYKIGEACKVLDIQPYVLRYWETEFPALAPTKSRSGQRVYSEKELAIIRRIKELLYDEGYTIAGAKKKLEGELGEEGELVVGGETAAAAPAPTAQSPAEKKSKKSSPPVEAADSGPADDERLRRMRSGIERALRQARELQELLQKE